MTDTIPALVVSKWDSEDRYSMVNCFLNSNETSVRNVQSCISVTYEWCCVRGKYDFDVLQRQPHTVVQLILPKRSCCGSHLRILTLCDRFSIKISDVSHFQKTCCGIRAKTFANILTKFSGIEDTWMADPNVKTINPASASSAKICSSFFS